MWASLRAWIMSASFGERCASTPDGQAVEVQLGHARVHEIGDDARGAARHGPAHVTMAAVEEEIAMTRQPEDRRPVRRHGSETGAVLSPIVVGGVREEIPGEAKDVVEVPRRPPPVVAGELRR